MRTIEKMVILHIKKAVLSFTITIIFNLLQAWTKFQALEMTGNDCQAIQIFSHQLDEH